MAVLNTSFAAQLRERATRGCLLAGLWLVAALSLAGATGAPKAQPISPEYQVKAVFLFDFAQFAEWPERTFATAEAPLIIGILGEDPFGAYLDELIKGEHIGHRALVVRRYRRVEDALECHILFVSRSKAKEFGEIFAALTGHSILTIGDADNFNRAGGIVRFATENGKIRLKINLDAAKAAQLTISSKILRPSTLVTADKE